MIQTEGKIYTYLCNNCKYCNEVSYNADITKFICLGCNKPVYNKYKKDMEIKISNIKDIDTETLKDAFISYYVAIEENEFYNDHNFIVDTFNKMLLEFIKGELNIRDVMISKLINRAIAIISINKRLKIE